MFVALFLLFAWGVAAADHEVRKMTEEENQKFSKAVEQDPKFTSIKKYSDGEVCYLDGPGNVVSQDGFQTGFFFR